MMRKPVAMIMVTFLISLGVSAGELGHYAPGVANIRDLAVPAQPGFYYIQYNLYYGASTYRDRNGNAVETLEIESVVIDVEADLDTVAITPVLMWVTEKKVLGGDYAFYVAPTLSRNKAAASLSTFDRTGEFGIDNDGLGDLLVQPLMLGWRGKGYEASLGLGLYLPIGEYDEDDDDNLGLGFRTGQVQGGLYAFLDPQQTSALMLAATYETHGDKDGTDIGPGDHLSLDYGFSQYLSRRLEVGLAGYSQWQTAIDEGSENLLLPPAKNEVHGYGVQLAYWVTPRLNLSFKHMQEYNARARFEGDWTMINLTYLPGALF